MNTTVGIIAEYNPFHNGHAYQLKKIRDVDPDATIAVIMSGSFTQRGTAAILDKWTRARLAVKNGADLVLELPYAFACRSAEHFARGGVQSLAALGMDVLAFGAETKDLKALQTIACAMEKDAFQAALHDRIAQGASYATALSDELVEHTNVDASVLHEPNNILAIEYLRALSQYAPNIAPLLIHRKGAGYHDTKLSGTIASASAIRKALNPQPPSSREGDREAVVGVAKIGSNTFSESTIERKTLRRVMPADVFAALCESFPNQQPHQFLLLRPLLARLLTMNTEHLQHIAGIGEGLEHRLLEKCSSLSLSSRTNEETWEHLTQSIATSRYPRSRIRRSLLHILTGFTQEVATSCDAGGPRYLRVLAMNARGAALLHSAKKTARLPIITKTSQYMRSRDLLRPLDELSPLQQMLLFDVRATELRNLALPVPQKASQDFLTSPHYVKQ